MFDYATKKTSRGCGMRIGSANGNYQLTKGGGNIEQMNKNNEQVNECNNGSLSLCLNTSTFIFICSSVLLVYLVFNCCCTSSFFLRETSTFVPSDNNTNSLSLLICVI